LVVARLCQLSSKAGTVDYSKSYFDEDMELHKIYRCLDRLHNTLQEKIQQISVEHTRRILGGKIGLVFYDVTALYFETDCSDDLRERGFSKDGKHAQPQVVLGLLLFDISPHNGKAIDIPRCCLLHKALIYQPLDINPTLFP
jgi:hypothetical protein